MSLAVFDGVSALVIDDVRFTSQRLLRTLEQIGIADTHAAPNGAAACKMIETGEIQTDSHHRRFSNAGNERPLIVKTCSHGHGR